MTNAMQALAATALLALAGCASTTPGWEAQLGDTVRQARALQLVDPAASSRAPRSEGIDGKAAAGNLRDYAESFDYVERAPKSELRTRINPR